MPIVVKKRTFPEERREEIREFKPSFYRRFIRPTLQTLGIEEVPLRARQHIEYEETIPAHKEQVGTLAQFGLGHETGKWIPERKVKRRIEVSPQIKRLWEGFERWQKTPTGKYWTEPVNEWGETKGSQVITSVGAITLLGTAGTYGLQQLISSPRGQMFIQKIQNHPLVQQVMGKKLSGTEVMGILNRVQRNVATKSDRAIFDILNKTKEFGQAVKRGVTVPRFGQFVQPRVAYEQLPSPHMRFYAGMPIPYKSGQMVKVGKESFKFLSTRGELAVLLDKAGREVTKKISELKPFKEPSEITKRFEALTPREVGQTPLTATHAEMIGREQRLFKKGFKRGREFEAGLVSPELGGLAGIPRKRALIPASFFEELSPEQIAREVRPRPAVGKPFAFGGNFSPTIRVMKQVGAYEQVYKPMKRAYWNKMAEGKDLAILEHDTFKGIKDDSPRDIAMFEYAERKLSPESEAILADQDKTSVDRIQTKFADFLKRINEKRIRLRKPPIKPLKNYAPHIFDEVVETAMKEKYPLSNETLGALQDFIISTKTTGRFLQRRTGAENYRKSLHAAWRAYKNMALDIIHYSEPTYAAKSYIRYYPPDTQRYLRAFLKQGMFKQAGDVDRQIKNWFEPLRALLEKVSPIPVSQNLNQSVADTGKALMHIGGIGLNYTTVVKNMTQSVLTSNLVDSSTTAKTMNLMTTDLRKFINIAKTNPMMLGRFPFEIREVDLMQILRSSMIPYRMVDMFNVAFAYNAGLIQEGVNLDKYLARYTNVDQVLADMETGEGYGKQIENAITMTAEMSQWSYYKPDMPKIFWEEPTASLAIFQSWPLYKTLHHYPELFNRLFTGKDFQGRPVSGEQRAGLLKDLVLMSLIATGLAKLGIDIRRTVGAGTVTVPFVNSPYAKMLQGFSKIMSGVYTAKESTRKWLINSGMRDIKNTAWLFVPAGIAIKRELRRFDKREKEEGRRVIKRREIPVLRQPKKRTIKRRKF